MNKKIILLTLLSTACLASCTPSLQDSSEEGISTSTKPTKEYKYKGKNVLDNLGSDTGTIKFQVGGGSIELQLWDTLISEFEKENDGIKIEKVTINDSDVLYTALAGGNAPDVIQVESHLFGTWAKQGALQAIQPLVEQESFKTDEYWEQAIEMFSFNTKTGIRGNGDLFSLPKDFGVNGVFVNKTIVDTAYSNNEITKEQYDLVTDQENPMTFEQYLDIAVALTKYDGTANSIYGSNRIYWESYLWSLGDDILDSSHLLNYQSENVKKVLQYSLDMVNKNSKSFCAPYTASSSTSSQDEQSLFTTGKLAMYWSGRWNVPAYDASNIKYYCIPTPVATKSDGNKGESIGWCSTIGYSISRNCKNTKMAYKFIKFLSSEKAYRLMNKLNYAVPGMKKLVTENEFADPKTYNNSRQLDAKSAKTFFKAAENARVNNASRFTTNRWIDAFEKKLELLFTGDIETVDEFLLSVRNEVNSALKSSDPQLFNK
ncbi:MAG: sugar ABC transporter substrate-binding protein [Candidatus Caccosoma sp.]|nr:sugar ABC transporter substrate-binding protein [Candidatus Caccosoma sp.]